MDYEITGVTEQPDAEGFYQVDYRTADGEARRLRYNNPDSMSPDELVQDWLADKAREAAAANDPPGSFGMYVKMDMSDRSMDELKRVYTDFAKSRGYEVDADMRPYKPAPA